MYTSIATLFGIYAILALSFNLEYGYTGQPNLGKVFFLSIGAYVAGAVVAHTIAALTGYGEDLFTARAANARLLYAAANPGAILGLFAVILVLATLAGAAFGVLASYPALRLRGDFLAIVLIAVGEVGRVFVRTYQPIAGGNIGTGGVPNPFVFLGDRTGRVAFSLVALALALVVFLLVQRLSNTPFGRVLKSVRDDELVSNVLGKRAPQVKALVLAVGSGIAAIAGVLWAFWYQTVAADDFVPQTTFLVVAMVLLGGAANHRGALVGAIAMTVMDRKACSPRPPYERPPWRSRLLMQRRRNRRLRAPTPRKASGAWRGNPRRVTTAAFGRARHCVRLRSLPPIPRHGSANSWGENGQVEDTDGDIPRPHDRLRGRTRLRRDPAPRHHGSNHLPNRDRDCD
ncbi:MAG: branched-chain amino acid ABC transporter permease [Methanobacteriota archaeon]|nr:MAG: branched-chain amino acid ABC transporter permease [Euryarchaeota archaeon]